MGEEMRLTVTAPVFKLEEQIEITFTRWAEFAADVCSLAAFVHQALTGKFASKENVTGPTLESHDCNST